MMKSPLRDRATAKFLSLLSAAVDRHELFRLERAAEKLSNSANRSMVECPPRPPTPCAW
jgi:hypothetical protein